ncbi:hypothetical protein [Candidatus Uabimicrobium amorphum]|uniref:PEGA domain-containing protein n=1 Tax=Uabimicrobium amorphum TaxID=2596890 RepID=A0A5S9IIB8_UABAM|nr:hypothetical protein [Candidatus Uabimicrobium amorphum]BBM82107.1 hypothetical protein UABAM_00450 [Candidatus Uabimicrobium amorphum]
MKPQHDDLQSVWMGEVLSEFYQQHDYNTNAKRIMERVRRMEERRKNMQRIYIFTASLLLLGLSFLYSSSEDKSATLIFAVTASHESQQAISLDQTLVNGEIYKGPIALGTYSIVLKKSGYQPLKFEHTVVAGENIIYKTLKVKKRRLVLAATSYQNVQIRRINEEKFFNIAQKTFVTPGKYEIFAKQQGYHEYQKQINVLPGEEVYEINVRLIKINENLRSELVVKFTNPQGEDISPQHIWVDDKEFDNSILLKQGEHHIKAFFQKYATVEKTFVINNNENKYTLDIKLDPYVEHKMLIGKKYHGMIVDSMKYPVEIFVDGDILPQHHVIRGDGFNLIPYSFFAKKGIRSIRVVVGFYYDEALVRDSFEFRDLRNIDVNRLRAHLLQLPSKDQVVRRVIRLTKDRQDKYKIDALSKEDKVKIINVLRSLQLGKNYKKSLRILIKKLSR